MPEEDLQCYNLSYLREGLVHNYPKAVTFDPQQGLLPRLLFERRRQTRCRTGQPFQDNLTWFLSLFSLYSFIKSKIIFTFNSLFFLGDTCKPLTGDSNTKVENKVAYGTSTYHISCLNSRMLFGNFGPGTQIAFCRKGSYFINVNFVDTNIGLKTPDCVGENLLL